MYAYVAAERLYTWYCRKVFSGSNPCQTSLSPQVFGSLSTNLTSLSLQNEAVVIKVHPAL